MPDPIIQVPSGGLPFSGWPQGSLIIQVAVIPVPTPTVSDDELGPVPRFRRFDILADDDEICTIVPVIFLTLWRE